MPKVMCTGRGLAAPEYRLKSCPPSLCTDLLPFLILNIGLVVQYTNDNGITWHLLRELDFMSYLEPQVVSIDLPREAKTPATAFRWWQPQHGKQWHPKNSLSSFTQPTCQCFSVWTCSAETSAYQKYSMVNSWVP